MEIKPVTADISFSDQINIEDLDQLAAANIKSIICTRPDSEVESEQQIIHVERRASALGIEIHHLPVVHDTISAEDVSAFESAYMSTPKPAHAYCRSGLRAITLWSLMNIKRGENVDQAIAKATAAGFDFAPFKQKFASILDQYGQQATAASERHAYQIVIVGGGASGIAVASSLLARQKNLQIAVIDPAELHYYQPGFTMVSSGLFTLPQVCRSMESVMPKNVSWIKAAVAEFSPENNYVALDNGAHVSYDRLIVCPGLKLDWDGVEGLADTLGKNGVTSNYKPECSRYTWQLVQQLGSGKAVFTQPPMPIKCAGAPQKAMYLAADHWNKVGCIKKMDIAFYNAGPALFGVADYVPALESYIEKYKVNLQLGHKLVKIDGPAQKAWFETTDSEGNTQLLETSFDMIHVCPPQVAPDFIRSSSLADEAGWFDVDQFSLRHKRFDNIWGLGDVTNAPNAKTAAAARVQAPIIATNVISDLQGKGDLYSYDGYGSCPLTVERGKIVLAEFGYGGKLLPTFPSWLLNGTRPTFLAWLIKFRVLPALYWQGMLKGREWLAKPKHKVRP